MTTRAGGREAITALCPKPLSLSVVVDVLQKDGPGPQRVETGFHPGPAGVRSAGQAERPPAHGPETSVD